MEYISKDALVAEIEKLVDKDKYHDYYQCAYRDGNNSALYALKEIIGTLEVKEVDLDAEVEDYIKNTSFTTYDLEDCDIKMTAKYFFELGMRVNNPITAADRGKAEELAYKKTHKKELLIKNLEEMKPFDDEYIPSPPITDKETYDKYVIPNFIRCGAIPTEKLIVGKKYYGSCRNASVAVWLGDKFEYQRTKFGSTFSETINNFDNDDGYDLFVPIRLADEENEGV